MNKALMILRDIRGEAIKDIESLESQIEELELFKSEHLRLEAELNAILHPNGDGPRAPSLCDLVAYIKADLKPKLCGTCSFDHCGCSVQDSLLQIEPETTFDTFGCVHHEVRGIPIDDQSRILTLEAQSSEISKELITLRRKLGVGIYCCRESETSNGWHHSSSCKNWVVGF